LNDGKVEYGTVPWSVGLYRQIKSRDGFYELICGGTLISPNKVITGMSNKTHLKKN